MSIFSLEDWCARAERYQKIKERVKSVLGVDALNSNHYYTPMLCNMRLHESSTDEEIRRIWSNYHKICNEIKAMLEEKGVPFDRSLLVWDAMSGITSFLEIMIDPCGTSERFKPAIEEFAPLYKRILSLAKRHKHLDTLLIQKKLGKYYLFDDEVYMEMPDTILDDILHFYDKKRETL